jgi:hypothetical protein
VETDRRIDVHDGDAKAAGLAGKDVWKQYPRNMLFARALTNGMRWFTPDLLRCADGYSEGDADFDVDEVISETVRAGRCGSGGRLCGCSDR